MSALPSKSLPPLEVNTHDQSTICCFEIVRRSLLSALKAGGVYGGVYAMLNLLRGRGLPWSHAKQALFWACTAGSIKAVHMTVQKFTETRLSREWAQIVHHYSRGIGGFTGVAAVLSVNRQAMGSILILWLTIRAFRSVWHAKHVCNAADNDDGRRRRRCKCVFRHSAVVVMCLTAAQILATYLRHPTQIDPSYLHFLHVHGGQKRRVYDQFKYPQKPLFTSVYPSIVGSNSAMMAACTFQVAAFKRALSVYVPMYAVTMGVSILSKMFHLYSTARTPANKSKSLPSSYSSESSIAVSDTRPADDSYVSLVWNYAKRYMENVFRSSTFLSLYCTWSWSGYALLHTMSRMIAHAGFEGVRFGSWGGFSKIEGAPMTRANAYMVLWASGLPVLVERPSRRAELAAYCATYALDILLRQMGAKTVFDKVTGALVMSVAAGVLCHYDRDQPALISKWILNLR